MAWLVPLARVGDRLAQLRPGFAVPPWPGYLIVSLSFAVLLAIAPGWTDRIRRRWLRSRANEPEPHPGTTLVLLAPPGRLVAADHRLRQPAGLLTALQ